MRTLFSAQVRHGLTSRRRISLSAAARRSLGEGGFFRLRVSITLLICAAAASSLVTGTLLAYFRSDASPKACQRALTFAERAAYQRSIEEIYWRHRIWPKSNPLPKPPLDRMLSQAQIEKKVEDYLRNSQALEDYAQQPITPEQLQAEMDRIARHTKQPEMLREVFAALANDPFVIAECLARPVLANRLLTGLHAYGQRFRRELNPRWVLKTGTEASASMANYTLPVIATPSGVCTDDTWTATSLTNAPAGRTFHTAVWTGSEMIVWGGVDVNGVFNTGGKYNPSTDSWTATTTANAPAAREIHTAVWTGSEMIVWGGYDGSDLNTGGRYNPSTDSWIATTTTNAPAARDSHAAVWTGSEMIVWGGFSNSSYFNTGGRYNPSTDSWTATSTTNAPDARALPTAVWTGSEMIAWGGFNSSSDFNTGGRYNPGTDSWTATSTTNAPEARDTHTAVWAGSEMIVWGGQTFNFTQLNTGGRYNPATDSWIATSTASAPAARDAHTAVWTTSQMIVWGGFGGSLLNTGGRYNPSSDSWTPTSTTAAPAARDFHTAVWTGSEMIIWGGAAFGPTYLNTGGRYCAVSSSPTPTPTATPTASSTPTCAGCSVTSPNCGTTVFSPPTDFVVQLNPPGPAALQASDFTVNGIPADSFMIVSGGAMIHFYFNTSPAVQGENTIHIDACAFFCGPGSVPEFTCTFVYESPTPTPTATATPRAEPTRRPRPTPAPRP